MLCRTGCIPYATQMVNALQGVKKYIFVSKYSPETLPKDNHKIRTYRNSTEFVFNSLLALPVLCFKVISLRVFKRYEKAYFPMFHHWNPILIQLCRWLNLEVIFTVHDGILHIGEQRDWEQRLLNFCIRKSHKLIFLSQHVKKLTRQKIGYSASCSLIPHPLLELKLEESMTRKLPAKPSLLFLGRVVDYKGVDLLLKAVSDIPNDSINKVTIAGRNYSGVKLEQIGNIPLTIISRWLEEREITELLTSHDILVLPYKEASQSGIVTLGITAAIPMICTNVGGLNEQLSEDEALFTEPSVEKIREAILRLIADENLYLQLHRQLIQKRASGNAGLGKVLKHFILE